MIVDDRHRVLALTLAHEDATTHSDLMNWVPEQVWELLLARGHVRSGFVDGGPPYEPTSAGLVWLRAVLA